MKKPRAVILVVGLALVALLVWPALAEAETTEAGEREQQRGSRQRCY